MSTILKLYLVFRSARVGDILNGYDSSLAAVVRVLLSTTNCSTWRGDSSGDPSHEVGDN